MATTFLNRGLIGERMVEANLLTSTQRDELLSLQKKSQDRIPLGTLALESGVVKDEELAPFLASYFDTPYLSLEPGIMIQTDTLNLIPQTVARRYNVLPLFKEADALYVAMADPIDLTAIDNLCLITGLRIKPIVSPSNQIRRRIEEFYTGIFLRPAEETAVVYESRQVVGEKDIYGWPMAIPFVRLLIERAYKNDVRIIHIQPEEKRMKVLFRVSNRLEKIASYPKEVLNSISKYLKGVAGLNAGRTDIPQVGFFNSKVNDGFMEIGVSILPTVSGERIVLEVPRRLGWLNEKPWLL